MPYNQNDPNYQTKNSKVLSYNNFISNIEKEKSDLKKVDRSFINNDSEIHQVPGNTKYKFNRVTRKMDDLSRAEVKDKIKAAEEISPDKKGHKYKIVEENINEDDYSDEEMYIDNESLFSKEDLFDAFVAGDPDEMRTGDKVDRTDFEEWFRQNKKKV